MPGKKIKSLRKEKKISLEEFAKLIGKSASTISRYENNLIEKIDFHLMEKIAKNLDTSVGYLMGITDDSKLNPKVDTKEYILREDTSSILVSDNDLAPEIPEGACVQIRKLREDESIKEGSVYYIEFNDRKVLRLVVDDPVHGLGFLPMQMKEQRIAYDSSYVNIIGKAVSMKVLFD